MSEDALLLKHLKENLPNCSAVTIDAAKTLCGGLGVIDAIKAAKRQGFVQGFVCAVVTDLKNHGEGTDNKDLWDCNKLTYEQCIENEIDQYDIEELIKAKYITKP